VTETDGHYALALVRCGKNFFSFVIYHSPTKVGLGRGQAVMHVSPQDILQSFVDALSTLHGKELERQRSCRQLV
jgi:hypothetical protein